MPDSCMVYIWWSHRDVMDPENFQFDPTGRTQNIVNTRGHRANDAARKHARAVQLFGIGHAGLNIEINNNSKYITWFGNRNKVGGSYQGSSQGKAAAGIFGKLRAGPHHLYHNNRIDELTLERDAEGYGPLNRNAEDYDEIRNRELALNRARKINLNVMKMGDVGRQRIFTDKVRNPFGIDLGEIDIFWGRTLSLPSNHADIYYSGASLEHNCCGMVARALAAGRLYWYAPPPNNQIYMGVRSLYNWCKEGQQAINVFNQAWNQIIDKPLITYRQGGRDMPVMWNEILRQSPPTLPTFEEWRRSSNVGWYAKRIEQIAVLDSLIRRYHGLTDREDRLRSLMGIMLTAVDHLDKKPRSDRRKAVIDLLGRVISTLESQAVVAQNPPRPPPLATVHTHGSAHLSLISGSNEAIEIESIIESRKSNQIIEE